MANYCVERRHNALSARLVVDKNKIISLIFTYCMKVAKSASQRVASLNMAQIFSGLHVAFAELSNDSKARVLFTKKVETGGGSVMIARPGAFFGLKGA